MNARRRYHCLRCERSVDGAYDPEAKAGNAYHCAECGILLNVDQRLTGYDPAFAESLFGDLGASAGKIRESPKSEAFPAHRVLGSLRLAADSLADLRQSDVYRVLEDAHEGGYADTMGRWLIRHRPDLEGEVRACLDELAS
jgi:DNA-directed RNA polymerase subunit RPC12/RpoP